MLNCIYTEQYTYCTHTPTEGIKQSRFGERERGRVDLVGHPLWGGEGGEERRGPKASFNILPSSQFSQLPCIFLLWSCQASLQYCTLSKKQRRSVGIPGSNSAPSFETDRTSVLYFQPCYSARAILLPAPFFWKAHKGSIKAGAITTTRGRKKQEEKKKVAAQPDTDLP